MRRLFQPQPAYGYKYIPNVRARVPHDQNPYRVQVNEQGFRSNRPFTPKADEGVFRILAFGDSFTAADSVSNEDRYTDVLETLLPGTEVFNFGLPGTGTDQHYLVYQEEAKDLDFDLVVIAVQVENIRRIVSRYREYVDDSGRTVLQEKPYFELADDLLVLHGVPVPPEPKRVEDLDAAEQSFIADRGKLVGLRTVAKKLGGRDLLQRVSRYQPVPEYDDPDHPAWRLMDAILRKWIDEIPTPVILFPLPLYQHVEGTASAEGYQARFATLHEPPHVIVRDPLPYYLRADKTTRKTFRFGDDIHPTPAAHRILATALADAVQPLVEERREPAR